MYSPDQMNTLRAQQDAHVKSMGGEATLEGREAALSYHVQMWVANEIVMGTHPIDAINAMLRTFSHNLANCAANLSSLSTSTPEEALDAMMTALKSNAEAAAEQPSVLASVFPATKQ